ncbi:MAG: hypothetical protein V2I56_13280 [Desulfobacteraceae bacterium]|jgi:hypothetical protein|nr:hypothetical protein [Desulfobacteraceae bacterium]
MNFGLSEVLCFVKLKFGEIKKLLDVLTQYPIGDFVDWVKMAWMKNGGGLSAIPHSMHRL